MPAKYTLEEEGLAGEGWNLKFDVVQSIRTEQSLVELFLRPLSNRADVRVSFSDSILTARLTLGS